MPRIEIRYVWRYYDEARRKWCRTSFHCTEAFIRIEHPDAKPVEGSRQELDLSDDPLTATSMAHFNTGIPKR